MGEDCELARLICANCGFKSMENVDRLLCKLCRAAEKMRAMAEANDEDYEIDNTPNEV